jgi:hypothetical protein
MSNDRIYSHLRAKFRSHRYVYNIYTYSILDFEIKDGNIDFRYRGSMESAKAIPLEYLPTASAIRLGTGTSGQCCLNVDNDNSKACMHSVNDCVSKNSLC